ncbi:MAG: hypothetical protein ACJA13_000281 [Paraglaciecola sp.]|jgi:hypothetical protein
MQVHSPLNIVPFILVFHGFEEQRSGLLQYGKRKFRFYRPQASLAPGAKWRVILRYAGRILRLECHRWNRVQELQQSPGLSNRALVHVVVNFEHYQAFEQVILRCDPVMG